MRPPYELPDRGQVTITDDTLVPMGDVWAYHRLTYTHVGGPDRPACDADFEIRRGVPTCTRLVLMFDGSRNGVRAKHFRAFKLDQLRDSIYTYIPVSVPNPAAPGQWMQRIGRGAREENRQQVKRATTRRNITQEFLKQTAEIHNSAPAGRRMHDLQAAYPGVTERQLRRYIAAAREKGFVND